jgi:hypothetical protein
MEPVSDVVDVLFHVLVLLYALVPFVPLFLVVVLVSVLVHVLVGHVMRIAKPVPQFPKLS